MAVQLRTFEINGHRPGPHLLITGGVHGDEFEPLAAIRRLRSAISPAALRGRVTLIECVNEPAFLRGTRTAEDGLDLARTCPGNSAGSITEQVAASLSDLIRTADYYVDLHTGGTALQVYPLAGYVLHPDGGILATQRRMARAMGLPFIWGTDPNLPGRSLSVARDAGVPAIYCEYLGGGMCSAAGVTAYFRGCLQLLVELGLAEGSLAGTSPLDASSVPLVVEDARPSSGYMQINHPAPHDGFFEPAVRLGQQVEAGEPLGTLYGWDTPPATRPIRERQTVIPSAYTGVVVVLRTFPRVAAHDCLGVVVETPGELPALTRAALP